MWFLPMLWYPSIDACTVSQASPGYNRFAKVTCVFEENIQYSSVSSNTINLSSLSHMVLKHCRASSFFAAALQLEIYLRSAKETANSLASSVLPASIARVTTADDSLAGVRSGKSFKASVINLFRSIFGTSGTG